MSSINLKSISVPMIEIINRKLPVDDQINITLKHGIVGSSSDTQNEFLGMCRMDMCAESEKDNEEKSFQISIEVRGTFSDESDSPDIEKRKAITLRELLPHTNAIMRTSMALAKIPISFIPDSVFAEFDH